MPQALSEAQRDLLALHLVKGVGAGRLNGLLEHFGSATRALQASEARLQEAPGVGAQLASAIATAAAGAAGALELLLAEKHGVRLLFRGDADYPAALLEIPDSPHVLYLRGHITAADAGAVALVGSRHCTAYGRKCAERLAAGLARAGHTVISGLARGIDGVAHQAALEAGGRTIAVVAGGLSSVYPPEHAALADRVAAAGAVVTESCMRQDPIAGLFHARNRIISGLAQVTVIVEAAEKSGALITASHAADQGRPVLAVPGALDSSASAGCHALIRKGAILCRGVDDVLEELHGVSALALAAQRGDSAAPPPAAPPPGLDANQHQIWESLGAGVRSADELAQQLGLPVPQLTTALLTLELKKAIRRLPGNRFERC